MQQDPGDRAAGQNRKVSFQERWQEFRPTKTVVGWSWVGTIVLTMIVGFGWGGWVTGGTAQQNATKMADDAVLKRLAPICVVQFDKDPNKVQKLKELKEASSYQVGEYVEKQGWATMPGETKPDSNVASECGRLLTTT
jgi:hypothetical protein